MVMNSFGGGGGFVANQSPGASQGSPRSYKGKRDTQKSFTSLTLAQIAQATKMSESEAGEVWLDGRELANISVVGYIRTMKSDSTRSTFQIDDGTAPWQEAQLWHDNSDNEAQQRSEYEQGKLVRIFGRLSFYESFCRIQAFRIFPVRDSNMLTLHLLECISHHLWAKKGPIQVASGMGSLGAMPEGSVYGQQAATGGDVDDSLTPEQQKVTAIIRGTTSDEGISIMDIVGKLQGSMSEAAVRSAIESLNDDGHIYSTVDDDHYRSVHD